MTTETTQAVQDVKSEAENERPVAVQTATTNASTVITSPSGTESGRGDVSASTIARMMGMATAAEFKVLEGKVDLLATKINSITGKLDRITTTVSSIPTGSDLERIDVQVSSLRTSLDEAIKGLGATLDEGIKKMQRAQKAINQAEENKE